MCELAFREDGPLNQLEGREGCIGMTVMLVFWVVRALTNDGLDNERQSVPNGTGFDT